MKDEKPEIGFGPNYQGFAVPFVATAYVMANSLEEAKWKAEAGLRKQQRVMLTKLDMLQPVAASAPDAIENLPDMRQGIIRSLDVEDGTVVPVDPPLTVPVMDPPYIVCANHKRDVHKKCACVPGETCNAAYWSAKLKGAK